MTSQLIGKRGVRGGEVEERGEVGSSLLVKHPAMNLSQLVPISTVAETSSSKDWGVEGGGVGPERD